MSCLNRNTVVLILTASSLVFGILGLLNVDYLTTLTNRGTARFTFKRLAGHNAVDFYGEQAVRRVYWKFVRMQSYL